VLRFDIVEVNYLWDRAETNLVIHCVSLHSTFKCIVCQVYTDTKMKSFTTAVPSLSATTSSSVQVTTASHR